MYNPSRTIDLTRTLYSGTPGVEFEPASELEKDGWNAQILHLHSHIGTHMDAPFHFGLKKEPETIDQYPPSQLMGRAWMVRIQHVQPKQLIQIEDMQDVADRIESGDNILIRTDWSKIEDYSIYRNQLPRISVELAHWLVDKKVNILGVESPSVADVNNLEEVTEVHHILLKGGIVIVEGLINLDQIESDHVWLIALPLKIANGDGAPCRAVAIEPL